jgi:hypothetical protein
MADRFQDFFPVAAHDTWKFLERNSGATVTIEYRAKSVSNRKVIELELTGLPAHVNPNFFDRLTLTDAGLELNRIRLTKRAVAIDPPLVVTLKPEESNQVAVLFPPDAVPVLNDSPPFAGKVTAKKLSSLGTDKKQFEIKLVATARGGEKVFRVERMQFQTGRGLTSYLGDMGGIFFVYERQT